MHNIYDTFNEFKLRLVLAMADIQRYLKRNFEERGLPEPFVQLLSIDVQHLDIRKIRVVEYEPGISSESDDFFISEQRIQLFIGNEAITAPMPTRVFDDPIGFIAEHKEKLKQIRDQLLIEKLDRKSRSIQHRMTQLEQVGLN